AMIGTVLLQRSEGGGLGIGSTGGFLTSRGTANLLTRTTAFLAAAFFATRPLPSILASWERKPRPIPKTRAPPGPTQPAPPPRRRSARVVAAPSIRCAAAVAVPRSSRRRRPGRRCHGRSSARADGPADRPLGAFRMKPYAEAGGRRHAVELT